MFLVLPRSYENRQMLDGIWNHLLICGAASRIPAGSGDLHGVRSMAQSAVPPPRAAPPAAVARSAAGGAGAAVEPRAQSFFGFPARKGASAGVPTLTRT